MSVTTRAHRTKRRRRPTAGGGAKTRVKKPTPPLSLRAYARHRGVSHQAVMRAVANGRLLRSVARIAGRPQIRDAALADREWTANTDLSRAPDQVKLQAAARAANTGGRSSPLSPAGTLSAATGAPPGGPGGASDAESLAGAAAREKHFRAKLAELKYLERAGQLVEADAIKAELVNVITTCRTKLLGIPSKAKQRLPHLSLEDLATLDDIVREALEELVPPAAQGAAA